MDPGHTLKRIIIHDSVIAAWIRTSRLDQCITGYIQPPHVMVISPLPPLPRVAARSHTTASASATVERPQVRQLFGGPCNHRIFITSRDAARARLDQNGDIRPHRRPWPEEGPRARDRPSSAGQNADLGGHMGMGTPPWACVDFCPLPRGVEDVVPGGGSGGGSGNFARPA
ncbi:hypothetical protein M433DRAFT_544325 [Acidomyces richmondensis BFW]|nr:MAG: hypothetical protein FE78DRAFT_521427 [Acidomyces sp. 'richmondensis']KYG42911.1 hypothetical protein M433DRAFT_544325 [Acidomyces richmondensis BFW]